MVRGAVHGAGCRVLCLVPAPWHSTWHPAPGTARGTRPVAPGTFLCMLAFAMAVFTREQVHAVAALANLELDETEIELFARQLGEILAYADEVQKVDTRGIPPTASVLTRYPADRPDQVQPSLSPEEALANAPDPAPDSQTKPGGLFRVPRVLG